jgi:hypothetical protein
MNQRPQNIIYYGGNGALFRSNNFVISWEIIGFKGKDIRIITIDPINPNNMYVGLEHTHADGDAIWLSKDSG